MCTYSELAQRHWSTWPTGKTLLVAGVILSLLCVCLCHADLAFFKTVMLGIKSQGFDDLGGVELAIMTRRTRHILGICAGPRDQKK